MVYRIVPAITLGDLELFERSTGWRDVALVKTEPFTQWVVEDWFCNRHPPLDKVGVQLGGWEKAKLRLLNGAHCAVVYLGGMAGHRYVHQAIAALGLRCLSARCGTKRRRRLIRWMASTRQPTGRNDAAVS